MRLQLQTAFCKLDLGSPSLWLIVVYCDAIYDVSQVEMECTDSDEDKSEEKRDEQVWWHTVCMFVCKWEDELKPFVEQDLKLVSKS